MKKCETCAFFVKGNNNKNECRRYPPKIIISKDLGMHSRFPNVLDDWWCGDYNLKKVDLSVQKNKDE